MKLKIEEEKDNNKDNPKFNQRNYILNRLSGLQSTFFDAFGDNRRPVRLTTVRITIDQSARGTYLRREANYGKLIYYALVRRLGTCDEYSLAQ